jgi:hypothetical protein
MKTFVVITLGFGETRQGSPIVAIDQKEDFEFAYNKLTNIGLKLPLPSYRWSEVSEGLHQMDTLDGSSCCYYAQRCAYFDRSSLL